MPRSQTSSIDSIIRDTADQVVTRVSAAIARHVGDLVQEGIRRELGRNAVSRRPSRRGDITRWVADNRARRVPNFVIEATGLDTKKKIVAKFGPNAAFEKGKPLPRPKAA
ncbi:MAG TPA: hypothetical protein VM753_02460 [Anaeromyxobacter sp.]|jgi:hypothetical protein|nr:hypothetical protein [Anaeromyxobacter sp.]